jgi:hypothetical protein
MGFARPAERCTVGNEGGFMNTRSVFSALALLLSHAAINLAAAAQVPYTFSTGASTCCVDAFAGSSVSGTFLYDPAAQQTGTTLATQNPANASLYGGHLLNGVPHSSYMGMSATVAGGALGPAGFSFLDPRGTTIISNGGFVSPPGTPPTDFMSLDADPFGTGGTHNIMPFSFSGYTLWNMRIFWGGAQGFTTDDQSLPSVLPSIPARLALDFYPTGTTPGSQLFFVFYDNALVTPTIAAIPEPETYALLLAGLGLLGFAARRRTRQQAQA